MTHILESEAALEDWFSVNEYKIAKKAVDAVLSNMENPVEISLYNFRVLETHQNYDVTVSPEDYKETLQVYLEVLEEYEDYLRCVYVKYALDSY